MPTTFSHDPARSALLSGARDASPAEELKCHALFEMMDTCQMLDRALRDELAESDLTVGGFRVLAQIIGSEPEIITPGKIATILGLRRQEVSTILGRLEVSGLLTSERTPGNRRSFTLKPTPAGRQVFATALNRCRDSITRLMSVLKTQDIALLDSACALLRESSQPSSSS